MPPFQNDVCDNGKVETGEECEPDVHACCTAECKYAARYPGCPCSRQFECADSYYCSCTGLDDCAAREIVDPICQRDMPEKLVPKQEGNFDIDAFLNAMTTAADGAGGAGGASGGGGTAVSAATTTALVRMLGVLAIVAWAK